VLSEQLKSDLSNLMLLCDTHHRLIDKVDVQGHPVERLQEMKRKHEERMELLTSLNPEKQSHVLLYGAKVGAVDSFLNHKEASLGMVPDRYPATGTPLALSLQNASWNDRDSKFWEIEGPHLESIFGRDIEPRFRDGSVQHISVFALAPQPLLIRLGTLLTDIRNVEVYQRQREPQTWRWQDRPHDAEKLIIVKPSKGGGKVALKLSLSATIDDARITSVLGDDVSIWTLTLPNTHFTNG